jgi:DUF4097 and DUF4098 domain-containing protein YvlB
MMFGAAVTIVAAVAALTLPPLQGQETRKPTTDETVAVTRGTRLTVDNFAGEVVIKAWDRDSLRVQARHASRGKVNIRTTPAGVVIRTQDAGRGSVDYEISVPSWMPVRVTGTYNFITVEGAQSEVHAETTRGDVVIKGGTGSVTARSIEGEVIVEGVRGRLNASSVNEGVRVTDAAGDVSVESTNGHITLSQIKSQNVEVSTINGNVLFEGQPVDGGRYRFTTHNGDIMIGVPESSNVSFVVRTYEGRFTSTLNVNGPPRSEVRQGRRTTYVLGNGSAEMELESFGGSIRLGAPGTFKTRTKGK